MIQLSDLDPDCLATIKMVRWDRIIEKHEGPEDWEAVLRWYDPEFMMIDGCPVLLPVGRSHHANITILRIHLECGWYLADAVPEGPIQTVSAPNLQNVLKPNHKTYRSAKISKLDDIFRRIFYITEN